MRLKTELASLLEVVTSPNTKVEGQVPSCQSLVMDRRGTLEFELLHVDGDCGAPSPFNEYPTAVGALVIGWFVWRAFGSARFGVRAVLIVTAFPVGLFAAGFLKLVFAWFAFPQGLDFGCMNGSSLWFSATVFVVSGVIGGVAGFLARRAGRPSILPPAGTK